MTARGRRLTLLGCCVAVAALVAAFWFGRSPPPGDPVPPSGGTGQGPTVRVAWMTSWATAGQVVESLIHTDITARHGIKAEFKAFQFGPPMNEAALAGSVDVTVVGDMPAISLLARSDRWVVIGRTVYFPYALMVRTGVAANDVNDLRGKTVGVPFGSGPHPTLYRWLGEAGLKIGSDVTVPNVQPNEIAEAVKSNRIDAVMTWEPTMTLLDRDGAARVLRDAKGVGFLCMSKDLIERDPTAARRFREAWREALLYAATHRQQTDEWFSVDSRMPTELLSRISVIDPNFKAIRLEDVSVTLTPEDVALNQAKADFAYEQKLIAKPLNVSDRLYHDPK